MSVEGARSSSTTGVTEAEGGGGGMLLRLEHNRISEVWKILLSSVSSLEQSAENILGAGLKNNIYVSNNQWKNSTR